MPSKWFSFFILSYVVNVQKCILCTDCMMETLLQLRESTRFAIRIGIILVLKYFSEKMNFMLPNHYVKDLFIISNVNMSAFSIFFNIVSIYTSLVNQLFINIIFRYTVLFHPTMFFCTRTTNTHRFLQQIQYHNIVHHLKN